MFHPPVPTAEFKTGSKYLDTLCVSRSLYFSYCVGVILDTLDHIFMYVDKTMGTEYCSVVTGFRAVGGCMG